VRDRMRDLSERLAAVSLARLRMGELP